jgi:D-alanyl-D-alanine-carboxypeptidase/D-alanyl-D-alanine-endopeptidase
MDALALALVVEMADGHRPMIPQKTGGLSGFMRYIAFELGLDLGVLVAVNRCDFGLFGDLTERVNEPVATLAPR